MNKTLALISALAAATSLHGIVIDDYTSGIPGGLLFDTTTGDGPAMAVDAPSPVGSLGGRNWNLNLISGSLATMIHAAGGSVAIDFGTSSDAKAAANIEYVDGSILGLDATQGGLNDAFQIDIVQFSEAGFKQFDWSVTVVDNSNLSSTGTATVTTTGPQSIAFVDMVGFADLSDVKTIELVFESLVDDGVDFQFDNFEIVPEPATYAALFGLFALSFAALRRRSN